MRPRLSLVGVALTAALGLVAGPGVVGAITPTSHQPVPVAAFRPLTFAAEDRSTVGPLDDAFGSANALDQGATFSEPGSQLVVPTRGPTTISQPTAVARAVPTPKPTPAPTAPAAPAARPARYVLRGLASFYEGGTTAMRLPRGTVVRICGAGGCVERTIRDYGPQAWTGRLVDMSPGDFRAICACGYWVGVQPVTVFVY